MEDPRHLVCVLIDEVESLTAARTNAMSGSEPSDAIRVVNALLTQLDSIKNAANVLILTTSNITGAIDLAFVDRADIKQYVGNPSQAAVYQVTRQEALIIILILIPSSDSLHLHCRAHSEGAGGGQRGLPQSEGAPALRDEGDRSLQAQLDVVGAGGEMCGTLREERQEDPLPGPGLVLALTGGDRGGDRQSD